jgi:hypothetical protein
MEKYLFQKARRREFEKLAPNGLDAINAAGAMLWSAPQGGEKNS